MIDSVVDGLRDVKREAIRSAARLGDMPRRLVRRLQGEALLRARFAREQGYPLDVANPQTFTEKLYCRMIRWNRDMDPRFTELADKLAVRPYVASRVGEAHLIDLLWAGGDPATIPFDDLRSPYIVKANHGCGHVIVVRDTPDRGQIIAVATEWLASNYYWSYREHQYFEIPPRLLVERFLSNPDGSDVVIYKFWCFDGVPRLLSVSNKDRSIAPYYDVSWNQLELSHAAHVAQPRLERPRRFDEMLSVAARLSAGIDFVRVDLYNVGDRVFFSELTFTPRAGGFQFRPIDWDARLGRMWTLRD
jgi:TupA-like ATPgrasp